MNINTKLPLDNVVGTAGLVRFAISLLQKA